jgi:hypothetical protein
VVMVRISSVVLDVFGMKSAATAEEWIESPENNYCGLAVKAGANKSV